MLQKFLFFTCSAFLVLTLPAHARQADTSAPVPSQIVSAKSIFISAAHVYKGGQSQGYNSFYAALQQWHHYQIVTAPSAADLVFDWACKSVTSQYTINGNGGTRDAPYILLRIRDPKTNAVLRSLKEQIPPGILAKNRDKQFDKALAAIVDQLKHLTGTQNQ
jgi:hypothetical protein